MGLAGEKFQLGTVGALSLSVVSSVSIVICNKALMSALGFIFGMRSNLASRSPDVPRSLSSLALRLPGCLRSMLRPRSARRRAMSRFG